MTSFLVLDQALQAVSGSGVTSVIIYDIEANAYSRLWDTIDGHAITISV